MGLAAKRPGWRIGYLICCLIYAGWVVHLSANDFEKVHLQYRETGARLAPAQSRKIARQALITACRGKQELLGHIENQKCLAVSPADLAQKEKVVVKRLRGERHRALRKLIVFSATFVVIFLLAPPLLVYGMIILFIKVFSTVKITK